jgi:hypothetical protein
MHCALHYTLCTTLHYTTLYYTLLPTEINHACDRGDVQTSIHYTTLHYTTLHSTLHYTMDYSLPKLITLVTVGMSKPRLATSVAISTRTSSDLNLPSAANRRAWFRLACKATFGTSNASSISPVCVCVCVHMYLDIFLFVARVCVCVQSFMHTER